MPFAPYINNVAQIGYRKDIPASQRLVALDGARKSIEKKPRIDPEPGWEEVDMQTHQFTIAEDRDATSTATLVFDRDTQISEIFCHFMTEDLLRNVWESMDREDLTVGSKSNHRCINKGKFSMKLLYTYFAVYIRILGHQNAPQENNPGVTILRGNIMDALAHFAGRCRGDKSRLIGINTVEVLIARFNIDSAFFPALSKNWQSVLRTLGQFLAGDEKLLHFTGNSGDIRAIPSKPDRIGLWFYELCATLPNGKPFIVHTDLWQAAKEYNLSVPVHHIVKKWARVVNRHNGTLGPPSPHTILVFDSYYCTKSVRQILNEAKVKFICSAKSDTFGALTDMTRAGVERPGDWKGVYCPESKELFIHKWDRQASIGKKYLLTNAFERSATTRHALKHVTPGYDLYKLTFNTCDHFNRALHDRKWPHRCGGRTRPGDSGHHDKFAMSATVQNTINAFQNVSPHPDEPETFMMMCIRLADELFDLANTLD